MAKQLKLYLIVIFWMISTNTLAENAPWVGLDFKGSPCPFRPQHDGPYDYLSATPLVRKKLKTVTTHHLSSKVLNHISGQTNVNVAVDLDFALRVFPNHHVALLSLSRYKIKFDKKILNKANSAAPPAPVECYFQRAINFRKKDSATMSLFAYFLKKMGHPKDAKKQYKNALEISPENSKIAYSYSLLLIELKNYTEALEYAQIAYKFGRPPNTLKKKLLKLGVWK